MAIHHAPRGESAEEALKAATREQRRERIPKCLTCRNAGWVEFVAYGVRNGHPHRAILHVLRNPEKFGQTFPPYPYALTTLQNHIYAEHAQEP